MRLSRLKVALNNAGTRQLLVSELAGGKDCTCMGISLMVRLSGRVDHRFGGFNAARVRCCTDVSGKPRAKLQKKLRFFRGRFGELGFYGILGQSFRISVQFIARVLRSFGLRTRHGSPQSGLVVGGS